MEGKTMVKGKGEGMEDVGNGKERQEKEKEKRREGKGKMEMKGWGQGNALHNDGHHAALFRRHILATYWQHRTRVHFSPFLHWGRGRVG